MIEKKLMVEKNGESHPRVPVHLFAGLKSYVALRLWPRKCELTPERESHVLLLTFTVLRLASKPHTDLLSGFWSGSIAILSFSFFFFFLKKKKNS